MNIAFDAPKRPALRWHGGKWKLTSWILSYFPPHTCYCEPFGGAASVLLRKPPAKLDVYNDCLSLVVNFFQVLREHPAELIEAIDLTPYSREEFKTAQLPANDPLEAARQFYVWSWQGRGRAGTKEPGGWRFMSRNSRGKTPVDDWNHYDHLWAVARRLKQVQIENGDAFTVIRRFDTFETLFYLDPPYVQSSRGESWCNAAYAFEFTDKQHRELAGLLHEVRGYVVLSGYPSDLYKDLFDGWPHFQKAGEKDNETPGDKTIEYLWLSPRTWQALQNGAGLPLFQGDHR